MTEEPKDGEPKGREPKDREPENSEPENEAADGKRVAARRRRMAEIFGDVLPQTTGDERDPGGTVQQDRETWYRQNRPPHHE